MIDEKIYMSTRIFRLFCERHQINAEKANGLFNTYKIWEYIDRSYDYLHLNGDESALSDISAIMLREGALL